MAPFSMPAPSIVPLRVPVFDIKRSLDTGTLIELSCETVLEHEIFYTLDGTKPQPYAGIVQGSKLLKYKTPIHLPAGKITIKAIAINALVHTMRSSVITKTYDVVKEDKKAIINIDKNVDKKKKIITKKIKESSLIIEDLNLTYDHPYNFDIDTSSDEKFNSYRSLEILPMEPELEVHNKEELCESVSEICTISPEPELKVDDNDNKDQESYISEIQSAVENHHHHHSKDEAFILDYFTNENRDMSKKGNKGFVNNPQFPCCVRCTAILFHCKECNSPSAITSKYCYQCGKRLLCLCSNCKELNSIASTYCQSCGKKLQSEDLENGLKVSYTDCSTMVEPVTSHASVQQSMSTMNKSSQTLKLLNDRKLKGISPKKTKTFHSPGRGYWRQQIDYVCNHLKSLGNNDMEFRDSISQPILNEFKKAFVSESNDEISITITFSRLDLDKELDD